MFIKSPLNYAGGKYKIIKQITPYFPNNVDTFVDLFCGGCNVGINVETKKVIFNDMNHLIIEMFNYFNNTSTDILLEQIEQRISEYDLSKTNKDGFLKFRSDYNNKPNPLDLFVLVSHSFNFQFRFNNKLEYNNPFGKDSSNFNSNMRNNLINFCNRLHTKNVEFTNTYFDEFNFDQLTQNDFVYLDPPYLITTASYNDGNRGFKNWDDVQETKLYNLMKRLTEKKIKYAMSNVTFHKGKENKSLQEFINLNNVNVHNIKVSYSNSCYNTNRGESVEVLITNY